jgi:hypothetical protein
VSDPAARARRGPAPVRRGRSRHGCRCRVRLSATACFGGEKRRVFVVSDALDYDPDLPDDPVPFVRKMLPANWSSSRVLAGQFLFWKRWLARAAFDIDLRPSSGDHIWRHVNCVGHHDDDAASVLGTVQGAALCSARACARPSGLDGACAQMIGGQLRDGRRMLLPSGTHGTLVDSLDGLEECSRVFDRFRTRARPPLVEVHFSRF